MIPLPLGLLSWILMGLAAGLAGTRLLPGEPSLGWSSAVGTGIAGAFLGGLLATVLGFGGMAGYDLRSLLVATLGAVLCLLLLRGLKKAP